MKYSIIVPIYKVENYLEKCIESIVNQSYKNIEFLLVDDGSPDNCPRICDEWVEKDSRIKVIHKNNEGLIAARKSGVRVAIGDYVCFVAGSVFSGMIFMRFFRWIVPILASLILKIGLQKQENTIKEKGATYYNYYAIPLELLLFKIKPYVILLVVVYSLVHLWYDYNGSSLTWAHFDYEWIHLGFPDIFE